MTPEQAAEIRRLLIEFHKREAARVKRGHAKNSCMAAYVNDVLARIAWRIRRMAPDDLANHVGRIGWYVNQEHGAEWNEVL